jgi:6-phosphofructokinase 1
VGLIVISFDCPFVVTTLRARGCETFVVREGYEGLVRGNKVAAPPYQELDLGFLPDDIAEDALVNNLRFGDGELLRQGEGDGEDLVDGKNLKGRYIIRVGWDDVRGWMNAVWANSVLE